MTVHKEGKETLIIVFILLLIINFLVFFLGAFFIVKVFTLSLSVVVFLFFVQFFRFPEITATIDSRKIVAPADGKVVVIEETIEHEYFKDKRIQVSIFMSPTNIHINWVPMAGIVKYYKYYKGLFLVAYHPKSSSDNERNTIVIKSKINNHQVLIRQIAGFLARRIVFYLKENQSVEQGQQLGFIKFGSRVDLLIPIGSKILVSLNQEVKGRQTAIAELPD